VDYHIMINKVNNECHGHPTIKIGCLFCFVCHSEISQIVSPGDVFGIVEKPSARSRAQALFRGI